MPAARRAGRLLLLFTLCAVSVAHAQSSCLVPLVRMGPVNPTNGFPTYYMDSNGIALQPCLDPLCDPALALPNPGAPLAFPQNFPDEFFYWRGVSNMATGTVQARLVLGLQGGFVNGAVVPGDQMVFSRVRVRISGLRALGAYTVTHPYGVLNLRADPVGAINVTQDVGVAAQQFQLALDGNVGPFLRFASGAVPPPPGTIGNPGADQTVTGSGCGQNFFRIDGPGLPGGTLQTDLFGTVVGRLAPLCGNGSLDPGEQCDDGNTANGDCCSSTCQIDPAGTPCNDGSVCTTGDVCTGGTPTCVGTAINCGDGNVCTTDSCDPVLGCRHANNTIACNDGNPCTTGDVCRNGTCSGSKVANGVTCSSANACTTAGTCTAGTCGGGAAVNCNDQNPCTNDSCNPATGCVHTPNTLPCDDGNPLTQGDTCSNGVCVGVPVVAGPLVAPLARVAGEDPSVAAAFPAGGDARFDGTTVLVTLGNLDPARYPGGKRCTATVTLGAVVGNATLSRSVAAGSTPPLPVEVLTFQRAGTVRAGDRVSVGIRCIVGAGFNRHSTQWAGVFAP